MVKIMMMKGTARMCMMMVLMMPGAGGGAYGVGTRGAGAGYFAVTLWCWGGLDLTAGGGNQLIKGSG
jgi:hypothetical protein